MKSGELRKEYAESQFLQIAVLSIIGDREEQQDDYSFVISPNECFAVICDGMGGHSGGKLASSTAVNTIINQYNTMSPIENVPSFLHESTILLDKEVWKLSDKSDRLLGAGTTIVGVLIRKKEMYWTAVGDSRLYLLRGEEFVQVTLDHNYHEYLKEMLFNKRIDQEEFEREDLNGDALISFLGLNGLQVIDYNNSPLELYTGDKLIMMSDGLYRLLEDFEIANILNNFENIQEALEGLMKKAERKARKKNLSRDNTTAIIIRIM